MEMANRGGLSEPTEYCLLVTARAVQFYSAIVSYDVALVNLMCSNNPRSLFIHAVQEIFKSSPKLLGYLQVWHASCKLHNIVQTAFNCFARNELKRFNGRPVAGNTPQHGIQ